MNGTYTFDVVIMGSGPGGYTAAIRCSQLGKSVAVIEKDRLGGVCLNTGCIPTKALIRQAEIFRSRKLLEELGVTVDVSGFDYSRVRAASQKAADTVSKGVAYLLKKNNITVIQGSGRLLSPHEVSVDGGQKISAADIIIATGSRPLELPGFEFDGNIVLSSTDMLLLEKPPERLCVLGAGAIGMEFSHIMNSFGVQVMLVELMDRILPLEDSDVSDTVRRAFVKRGIAVHTSSRAVSLEKIENSAVLTLEDADKKRLTVTADKVLVAAGRTPNTGNLGLEELGIAAEKGYITIGSGGETIVPGIYAIGDVVPTPLLAHVASKEGELAAEHIAGNSRAVAEIDLSEIPTAVYCEPQVASFGLTQQRAEERGIASTTSTVFFRGLGKAVATGEPDGFVKLVHDPDGKELFGAHLVGAHVTELMHELLLAKTAKLPLDAVARMIHAHPTLSEGVMETARKAVGRAIHI